MGVGGLCYLDYGGGWKMLSQGVSRFERWGSWIHRVFFSTMLQGWKCRIGRERGSGRLELGRAVHRYIGYWFVRDDNEVFQ